MWQKGLKMKKNPNEPLVKGGQGRTEQDVIDSTEAAFLCLGFLSLGLIIMGVIALVGMLF